MLLLPLLYCYCSHHVMSSLPPQPHHCVMATAIATATIMSSSLLCHCYCCVIISCCHCHCNCHYHIIVIIMLLLPPSWLSSLPPLWLSLSPPSWLLSLLPLSLLLSLPLLLYSWLSSYCHCIVIVVEPWLGWLQVCQQEASKSEVSCKGRL